MERYRAAVECLKKHRQENENFTQFIEVQAESGMNTGHIKQDDSIKFMYGNTMLIVHYQLVYSLANHLCTDAIHQFLMFVSCADCSSHCSCELQGGAKDQW